MKMLMSFVDNETVSQEGEHKLTRTWLRDGGAEICIRAGPQVAQDSLFYSEFVLVSAGTELTLFLVAGSSVI